MGGWGAVGILYYYDESGSEAKLYNSYPTIIQLLGQPMGVPWVLWTEDGDGMPP